jgi:predicted glycoside hydrolase/deacetylase ChbG (UPF0249 family)
MKTQAVFCADDWGMSPGINDGILALAKRGWLQSVSCMATAPFVDHGLEELKSLKQVELHLHLNLTYGAPLADVPTLVDQDGQFYSHRRFLSRVSLHRVARRDLQTELRAQIDALRSRGVDIAALDGHHHVHLWPAVFSRLRDELQAQKLTRLRLVLDPAHRSSYWQSRLFLWLNKSSTMAIQPCRYLTERDQQSPSRFANKLSSSDQPLLIHPALYNDFAKVKMSDSLLDQRVSQFRFILDQFNGREEILGK